MIRMTSAGLVAALVLAAPERAPATQIPFDVTEVAVWAEAREDGSAVGIGPAWAHLLLERAHLHAEVRALPYGELLAPGKRADRGFMIVVGANDFPLDGVTILSQLMDISVVVVPKRGLSLKSRFDLIGLNGIAVARGTPLAERLGLAGGFPVEPVPSMANALRMLSAGHVDAVAGVRVSIEILAARMGMADQLGTPFELARSSVELVVESTLADGPEAASLREAAREIAREGGFARIVDAALRGTQGARADR
jgi:hypothetical protein